MSQKPSRSASSPIDRSALRKAYRQKENTCAAARIDEAAPASALHDQASAIAVRMIEDARARKPGGVDAFMQQFALDSEEGVALMCLAEALLRVPDNATADLLIRDKLADMDWGEHLGSSPSTFVNAATFSLMLTGEVLESAEEHQQGLGATLRRTAARLGEPVIRKATLQAMRILGGQFVFGRDIEEALTRAAPERKRGLTHSYDMLGEAAMTFDDAERYRVSYTDAIARLAREQGDDITARPGISVKLSALYPHYDVFHANEAKAALLPILRELAGQARDANLHFTIDAEEADRLELSLDIIEALAGDDTLFNNGTAYGWAGFGLAVQAYQKRAVPLCDWVIALARKYDRQFMVRLVKGAYWDSEIKLSQQGGFADYPVFTRKQSSDVSYLACAARLIKAADVIYPAFATHNAYSIAAIKALITQHAQDNNGQHRSFEFQRLHGMGEEIYAALAAQEKKYGAGTAGRSDGEGRSSLSHQSSPAHRSSSAHQSSSAQGEAAITPVRIYAPVGSHRDLLAYLVRRLLENGANSSFINRMGDAKIPAGNLARDPAERLRCFTPLRNEAIPLPCDIFPGRRNSMGVDLSDPLVRDDLQERLGKLQHRIWSAEPTFSEQADTSSDAAMNPLHAPHDRGHLVGHWRAATQNEVEAAIARADAAQAQWNAWGGEKRADVLEKAAEAFEDNGIQLISLCQREAGKSLNDAVLELREAVDFLRFYAAEARAKFAAPIHLPGPTGEENRLTLNGRGTFAAIAPWNFPLAIFIGPAAAALAAGNCVVAKPAAQTPLIAALAVQLCHQAGVPIEVLQLLPGGGDVGAFITQNPIIAGVAFTGSTRTARVINRNLASRDAPIATLIAETGGQNAMIVDSSALPEQVTRDVMASAFQSAGQRCSALRVLYVQEDVADEMLRMIKGAFEALVIGDPMQLSTDVGPVIDAEAKAKLEAHIAACKRAKMPIQRRKIPRSLRQGGGFYVAPTIIEIRSIAALKEEHFGPILHVARFGPNSPTKTLEDVVDAINNSGYGLTLGLHSRIQTVRERVEARAKVGNFYVNRNQIGAVVESQPFGGEGLSGSGPKAGGPHYIERFATERAVCIDTTAAGGNASLLAG